MSRYAGFQPTYELPGKFSMTRRLASATYGIGLVTFAEIDFRSALWMQDCPLLTAAQQTAAGSRGEIKRVEIRLISGTIIAVADEPTPDDRYNSADADRSVLSRSYHNVNGVYRQYWSSDAGAVVVEVEIYFDIPTTQDVA